MDGGSLNTISERRSIIIVMENDSIILVTGCQGMTGSAVVRTLLEMGYKNVVGIDRNDCDLTIQDQVWKMFNKVHPDYVFHIAAKVGGINANNTQSADFIYENLMMQCNVIETSRLLSVKKLIFCGSACIYPKDTPMPIKEEYLLTGKMEQTNVAYAIAKIAGVIATQMYRKQYGCNFISAMPTNLYGIGDNFHLQDSHVLPALLRKFHEAKISNSPTVEIWGTGNPKREFLYVDDLADALIFLMNNYNGTSHINVGTGVDIPIREVIIMIANIVGYEGSVTWNTSYPDGVYERRLDVTEINGLGWKAKVNLLEGLTRTYDWFLKNYNYIRK